MPGTISPPDIELIIEKKVVAGAGIFLPLEVTAAVATTEKSIPIVRSPRRGITRELPLASFLF